MFLGAATGAFAAVQTDQTSYSPGSTVTISGDNSDNAGYLAGETVNVLVAGPSGDLSCTAMVDDNGAWSCQVVLASDASAVGGYSYTATGMTSLVSQTSEFTDSGCDRIGAQGPLQTDNKVSASFSTSGSTATYSISTPNESSSGGIPGLIEYCVVTSPLPPSATAFYATPGGDKWVASINSSKGFFDFERPTGDPTNLPFDGSTQVLGDAVFNGAVPSDQSIVLHINDPNVCKALYPASSPLTCFVLPGTGAPPAAALTASKDASPSLTTTYKWDISKAVDQTTMDIASGGSAKFNYTVSVTHDGGTDGKWAVSGAISLNNPNNAAVSGVTVTDAINDTNASCTVSDGTAGATTVAATNGTVPANAKVDYPYTCSYSAAPAATSQTNTATITWGDQALSDGSVLAAGTPTATATVDWTKAAVTRADSSVTVTDTLGGNLGTVSYTDASPKTFTYSHEFSGDPAGTCTKHDNTATFTTDTSKTTGSDSQSATVCVGGDLSVVKTAIPSFTRTYTWGISKAVDNSKFAIASGDSATPNYTVSVTHDNGTDSAWIVKGTITVSNPNDWEAITADVTDAIDNGGACTVAGGTNVAVPKSDSVTLDYSCTYASAPSPASGTNTATATWDSAAAFTPSGSATGSASADFGVTSPNVVDGSVAVTDTLGGNLGTVSYTDASPETFTYSHEFSGDPAGTCTKHDNTATFTTDTSKTTGSDSQSATVCVGADLSVGKTANPTFTRTFGWKIVKTVDGSHTVSYTQTAATRTLKYVVTVTKDGGTDSGWQVSGTITVKNPNDWEPITGVNVTDAVDNGGTCTVTNGTGLTIPKNGSVDLGYTCSWSAAPTNSSGTNTATATWTGGVTPDTSATGKATFTFDMPTTVVHDSVNLSDVYTTSPSPLPAGFGYTLTSGTLPSGSISSSQTFNYSELVTVPHDCMTLNNTAKFTATDSASYTGSDSASAKVCRVPAKTGALTMGFWQNKNGQGIITGGASTGGVCNSGTWLRQYAPFQDLSATATCAQVGTYVTNIIKAANASGAAMNAMLKAQMLATALDVHFSDPSLGGNKISAPAPLGGVSVDLTTVCGMVDGSSGSATCSGTYENVSAAFGGATSMTVSGMLTYAASQSNAGGSTWYGQSKTTQGLAKDAFDAINNQAAFSTV